MLSFLNNCPRASRPPLYPTETMAFCFEVQQHEKVKYNLALTFKAL